jgi:hypothetical protein
MAQVCHNQTIQGFTRNLLPSRKRGGNMAILHWGRGIGLHFENDNEYFYTLGFLANQRHGVEIYTHDNQASGAWSGQGKLALQKNRKIRNLPRALDVAFGYSGDNRLSVTEYVKELVKKHRFVGHRDPTGNRYTYYRFPLSLEEVLQTVPDVYKDEVTKGFNA